MRDRSPGPLHHHTSGPSSPSLKALSTNQRRLRPRRILILIVGVSLALFVFLSESVQSRTIFFLNSATPRQVKWLWNVPDNSKVRWTTKCPNVIPGVLASKWAGSWDTPRLRKPVVYSNGTIDTGPALLAMHIFSMPNAKGRAKRKLIREHNPLDAISDEYRHLVDFKFVIGYPRPECRNRVNEVLCPGVQAEEAAIREEQQYGDLLRVEGLKNGENMDEGKTWMWLRQLGRQEREAQWVMKCDDDVSAAFALIQDIWIVKNTGRQMRGNGEVGGTPRR